jgi:formylglycine-generating enzyme required for sulfatase activity
MDTSVGATSSEIKLNTASGQLSVSLSATQPTDGTYTYSGLFALILLCIFLIPTAAAALQPGQTFKDCPECPEMVIIPSGQYSMGSSTTDTDRDLAAVPKPTVGLGMLLGMTQSRMAKRVLPREHPQHIVRIAYPFALGKYLVTRGEFAAFVRDTGYVSGPCIIWSRPRATLISGGAWMNPGFQQNDKHPVVCVNWLDANAYIAWLNKKVPSNAPQTGVGHYRLPSESEWEFAARAGTSTARWWGDDIGAENAKCADCGDIDDSRQTVSVGTFPPNQFGLYDMLGNAWEWTEDCWHESYNASPADGRAWTEDNCGKRVFRGGGWNSDPWLLRSADRGGLDGNETTNEIGFRVAKSIQ